MTTILGPVAGAFPLNEGWHMKGQTPRKPQIGKDFGDDLRRLSDLTIHEIFTVHHSTSTATIHQPRRRRPAASSRQVPAPRDHHRQRPVHPHPRLHASDRQRGDRCRRRVPTAPRKPRCQDRPRPTTSTSSARTRQRRRSERRPRDWWRRKGRPERRTGKRKMASLRTSRSPHGGERRAPTRIGVGGKLKIQCILLKNPNSLVHLRARHEHDVHIAYG